MNARFVAVFLLAAFGLHLAWELLQCGPFYVAGKFPLTAGGMLHVTVADVGLSALVYVLIAVGLRDAAWAARRTWARMIVLVTLGAAFAVAIELHALATGRWSYSALMPRLPGLGAGLLPVFQLALVTAASTWLAHRWSARRAATDSTQGRNLASTAPAPQRTGLDVSGPDR